jgi:type IV pilus assembly protein PilN
MAKINLLPWREELRKQQQQEFLMGIVLAVLFTMMILGGIHMHIEGLKDYQSSRNQRLESEIAVLDRKINEIKEIEQKKNKLLTKIDVIQQLQESRPQVVHLFDELPKTTPEGVFLTQFEQAGATLTLIGKAQSNARVSAFMRAIETSAWLKTPKLNVIQGQNKSDNSNQLSDFTLIATQGKETPDDATEKDS